MKLQWLKLVHPNVENWRLSWASQTQLAKIGEVHAYVNMQSREYENAFFELDKDGSGTIEAWWQQLKPLAIYPNNIQHCGTHGICGHLFKV